ncbi:MAG: hypothetical protein ACTSVD_10910, partial [Candidatus Thorarchaeota archaeon]
SLPYYYYGGTTIAQRTIGATEKRTLSAIILVWFLLSALPILRPIQCLPTNSSPYYFLGKIVWKVFWFTVGYGLLLAQSARRAGERVPKDIGNSIAVRISLAFRFTAL